MSRSAPSTATGSARWMPSSSCTSRGETSSPRSAGSGALNSPGPTSTVVGAQGQDAGAAMLEALPGARDGPAERDLQDVDVDLDEAHQQRSASASPAASSTEYSSDRRAV